jgi:septal ring factor EnvC (AmiA/AmiB activator)
MLVDVKDSKFVRDTNSMALINKDSAAREDYYSKVRMLTNQKQEINNIKSEIASMKTDVNDIKELLKQLIGKGSNG